MDGDTIADKTSSIAEAKLLAENQKKAGVDQFGRMAEAIPHAGDALRQELLGTAPYAANKAATLAPSEPEGQARATRGEHAEPTHGD